MLRASVSSYAAFVPVHPHGALVAHTERLVNTHVPLSFELEASGMRRIGDPSSDRGLVIDGVAVLDELVAEVIFKNHPSGVHPYATSGAASAVLIERSRRLPLRRAVARYGASGDPAVSLQFLDTDLTSLGRETPLGRLSEAPFRFSMHLPIPSSVLLWLAARDCSGRNGPAIELSGESSLDRGVIARVTYREEGTRRGEPPFVDTTDVVVLAARTTVPFPQQVVHGGVGGNPRISVRFVGGGSPVGEEFLVGRCVQLG